jgi:iron complex outermembrane receptor protein
LAAAGVLCSSQRAGAQDTRPDPARVGVLEEVVVTARKRTESLQEVPLSITAFSAEAISQSAIYDVRDVARLAPNVTLQTTGGAGTGRFMPNLTFRGLQNVFPQPRAQVGAVFVDGAYVLGGVNAINTNDVERVEVLRGPQNAYFGRNTFAGAINFITKTPGDEFKGEITGSGSTRGSYSVSGSVEGPVIADRLSARALVALRDKRGHYVASDGGRLGNESTDYVSATLYATPTDALSIRVRGSYQEDDDGPGQVINLSPQVIGDTCNARRIEKGTTLAGARGFNVSLPYFCDKIPTISDLGERIVDTNTSLRSPLLASLGNPNGLIDPFINNSLNDPQWRKAPKPDGMGLKREIYSLNIQTQYEFESGIAFTVNYAFDQNYSSLIVDVDRSRVETTYAYIPQFSRTRMIEARLRSSQEQSIRWLIGGTYFNSYFASAFGSGGSLQYQGRTLPTQPFRTAVLPSAQLGANPRSTDEVAKVRSVFGSVDWDVFDSLTLTGELRYQEDRSVSGGVSPPQFVNVPNSIKFTDWLPRVIAKYTFSPDWNVYASWSRGVLPGVENVGFTQQTAFRQQLIRNVIPNIAAVLDSDVLDNYELGMKQTLLDGRLRYNIAGYYMTWRNAKAQTALVLPATSETNPAPFTVPGVTTQGSVDIYGVELEGAFLLTDAWEVAGGVAVQKSEFKKWGEAGLLRDLAGGQSPGAIPGNVAFGAINWEGNEMQRQPRMTANLNSTYRATLSGDWGWFVRGEMTYTGKAWDSTANIVQSNDFFRVNARAGVERDDLTVEFYVLNLFNDKNWDYVSRTAIGDFVANAANAVLPRGNAGFLQGFAVQAPDKRDFGVRVRYAF